LHQDALLLCIGQDNGDDTNTLALCCIYTGLATVSFSFLAAGWSPSPRSWPHPFWLS